ncbi:hypothetical protein [Qingshengfaniella alkalisoli]|uniref:Uncharacterized protein n=1 Tax=Qingshengfaniella alkalisoli TaxID=2599296 RepID=A0A5B8IS08_9RHOB|nr:hypothetical protein [Qingshengfaniella alkalisoli]QDY68203.1 hypothetical protein FPZ52_00175 [Qingshengfaniella alkalisoli]
MRKLSALGCIVGFGAFWVYGYIALSSAMGQHDVHTMNFVLCALGLFVGVISWAYIERDQRRRKLPPARARLEEELAEEPV